jgi:hypothetical protein
MALAPPEGEPTVTRVADAPPALTDPRPTPALGHSQASLVVDDFAWDLDEPGDYSAPV